MSRTPKHYFFQNPTHKSFINLWTDWYCLLRLVERKWTAIWGHKRLHQSHSKLCYSFLYVTQCKIHYKILPAHNSFSLRWVGEIVAIATRSFCRTYRQQLVKTHRHWNHCRVADDTPQIWQDSSANAPCYPGKETCTQYMSTLGILKRSVEILYVSVLHICQHLALCTSSRCQYQNHFISCVLWDTVPLPCFKFH